jgi:hypothetical protein
LKTSWKVLVLVTDHVISSQPPRLDYPDIGEDPFFCQLDLALGDLVYFGHPAEREDGGWCGLHQDVRFSSVSAIFPPFSKVQSPFPLPSFFVFKGLSVASRDNFHKDNDCLWQYGTIFTRTIIACGNMGPFSQGQGLRGKSGHFSH